MARSRSFPCRRRAAKPAGSVAVDLRRDGRRIRREMGCTRKSTVVVSDLHHPPRMNARRPRRFCLQFWSCHPCRRNMTVLLRSASVLENTDGRPVPQTVSCLPEEWTTYNTQTTRRGRGRYVQQECRQRFFVRRRNERLHANLEGGLGHVLSCRPALLFSRLVLLRRRFSTRAQSSQMAIVTSFSKRLTPSEQTSQWTAFNFFMLPFEMPQTQRIKYATQHEEVECRY